MRNINILATTTLSLFLATSCGTPDSQSAKQQATSTPTPKISIITPTTSREGSISAISTINETTLDNSKSFCHTNKVDDGHAILCLPKGNADRSTGSLLAIPTLGLSLDDEKPHRLYDGILNEKNIMQFGVMIILRKEGPSIRALALLADPGRGENGEYKRYELGQFDKAVKHILRVRWVGYKTVDFLYDAHALNPLPEPSGVKNSDIIKEFNPN